MNKRDALKDEIKKRSGQASMYSLTHIMIAADAYAAEERLAGRLKEHVKTCRDALHLDVDKPPVKNCGEGGWHCKDAPTGEPA